MLSLSLCGRSHSVLARCSMHAKRFAMLLPVLWASTAWGQGSDAALRDRVLQLVERLDSSKMEARQGAEEALVKLGPRILPFLPEVTKGTSAERKQRLVRIRAA